MISKYLPGNALRTRGGETGAMLRSFDWGKTCLGPLESWDIHLRATVDVLQDSPVPKVLMWGPEHRMIYNDGYIAIAGGYHPRAFGGRVPEIWPEIWDFNSKVLEAGFRGEILSYNDQRMVLNRSGKPEEVFFDLFYTPIYQDDQTVGGVLCTVVENTDRVKTRVELAYSISRFEAAVAAVDGYVWTNDAEGRMAGPQPGWQALTGQSEAESLGYGWSESVHPDDRPATISAWQSAVAKRETFVFEHRVLRHDGQWRWFSVRAVPTLLEDGSVREWVGIHTDITRQRQQEMALLEHADELERQIQSRRQAEEQLRQFNETLETRIAQAIAERKEVEAALAHAQKMESIGNLTGGVAHDFNNLLQVISGNLQLLAKDIAGNERAEKRVANAMAGVSRGARLAAQLLAFGRKQALEPKVVNVTRFVRGMDDMLRRALGEGIEIETVVSAGLWNTFIDPGQIENALLNLAINARDAMDGQGRLTIELGNACLDDNYAQRHNEVASGQYVMLAVSDTGCGIPAQLIDKVYDPFFTTKPEGKGSGLGLSMVYGFVKQSGGHIKIYSEPGFGTTIRLYLPRALEAEDIEVEIDATPIAGGSETVLVVEDDEEVRTTVVDLLTELGYRVLRAVDASSALSVVESGIPVDLLFTDVVMPGPLKSPDLARKVRERLPGIAVLFTSGYTENSIVHGGRLDAGVNLLSKPYTKEALARKVRQVLGTRSAPQTESEEAPENGAILLVEDDGLIRLNTADLLQELGHEVLEAGSAEEAEEILRSAQVRVLLTDIHLPGQSGIELAFRALALNPQIGLIFATGERHVQGLERLDENRFVILSKPYDSQGLEQAISQSRGQAVRSGT